MQLFCCGEKQTPGQVNNGQKLIVISSEKHTWEMYQTFIKYHPTKHEIPHADVILTAYALGLI